MKVPGKNPLIKLDELFVSNDSFMKAKTSFKKEESSKSIEILDLILTSGIVGVGGGSISLRDVFPYMDGIWY